MKIALKTMLLLFVLAIGSLSMAQAQEDKVVATVNGDPITESDVLRAFDTFGEALGQVPEASRREILINIIAETRLIASAAESAGIDKTDSFKGQLQWMREQALRITFIQEKLAKEITEGELKARYEQFKAQSPGGAEIRARHILLKAKEDAEAVVKELDDGADFAELAKQKSTGPSGPNGGDLGFFGRGRMVPAFEAAAFALEPGQYSKEPVATQFGFHIIKVEERREQPQPSFAELEEQLRTVVLREKMEKTIADLRKDAKIEIK